jgi:hypothetical protein
MRSMFIELLLLLLVLTVLVAAEVAEAEAGCRKFDQIDCKYAVVEEVEELIVAIEVELVEADDIAEVDTA